MEAARNPGVSSPSSASSSESDDITRMSFFHTPTDWKNCMHTQHENMRQVRSARRYLKLGMLCSAIIQQVRRDIPCQHHRCAAPGTSRTQEPPPSAAACSAQVSLAHLGCLHSHRPQGSSHHHWTQVFELEQHTECQSGYRVREKCQRHVCTVL